MPYFFPQEYIEFCEKAEKLQKGHELKKGDYFTHENLPEQCQLKKWDEIVRIEGSYIIATENCDVHLLVSECIWLPTEDQLDTRIAKGNIKRFLDEGKISPGHSDKREEIFSHELSQKLAYLMQYEYKQLWNLKTEEWEDK